MAKNREFWIQSNKVLLYSENEPPLEGIHVREVKPIDWEKIWKEFSPYEFISTGAEKKIQELVEKAIRGELE